MPSLVRQLETAGLSSMVLALIVVSNAFAQEHAPLPEKLLSAQSVYLSNESGDLKAFDAFYRELRKWGRFRIVTAKDGADLVAVLTTAETSAVVVGTATTVGTNNVATSTGSAVAMPRSFLQLRLQDATTGETLWSDSAEKWLASGHAPSKLVGNLKQRVPKVRRP